MGKTILVIGTFFCLILVSTIYSYIWQKNHGVYVIGKIDRIEEDDDDQKVYVSYKFRGEVIHRDIKMSAVFSPEDTLKRYFFRIDTAQPINFHAIFTFTVPDSIKEAPYNGWDSLPKHVSPDDTVSLDTVEARSVLSDSSISVHMAGKVKYVLVDTMKFLVPDSIDIRPTNLFNGIYLVKNGSLEKHNYLITANFVFLTIYEDVGTGYRGNLFAIDRVKKSFVMDTAFGWNHLRSSAGVFVMEADGKKVFTVHKPHWIDTSGPFIVSASVDEVRGGFFKEIKSVYMPGDEVPGDTALLHFYRDALLPRSKRVFPMPI
ncbi:MAG: hypothetical protein JST68_27300 [Bacteroidetes bacterium]|nr:hypothetical protein [Bacteroidota bacterium]